MSYRRPIASLVALLLLGSCAPASVFESYNKGAPRLFDSDAYPQQLSQWNLLRRDGTALKLNPAAQTYDVNMPLFSDYASKHRSLWLPPDTRAARQADGKLVLPVGSIISKTFLYPEGHAGNHSLTRLVEPSIEVSQSHLVETRLLVKQTGGWEAMTYIWDGDDAYLKRTGAVIPVNIDATGQETFSYVVPSANECASCHATDHRSGALQPIGLQLAQLQSAGASTNASAGHLAARNWLNDTTPAPATYAAWEDRSDPTQHARGYLDSNCAHCHSATGPAKTSGLDLTRGNTAAHSFGICKAPIASGKGSGGRLFSITPGEPEKSIITYRLESTDPSRRMPEIGRSLTHAAGLQIVNQWIANLTGECR